MVDELTIRIQKAEKWVKSLNLVSSLSRNRRKQEVLVWSRLKIKILSIWLVHLVHEFILEVIIMVQFLSRIDMNKHDLCYILIVSRRRTSSETGLVWVQLHFVLCCGVGIHTRGVGFPDSLCATAKQR